MSDNFIVRDIVTGLIISDEFLRKMENIWQPHLIKDNHARKIASWCWEYYNEYSEAPKSNIEQIYTEKLKDGMDETESEWIEDLLDNLSENYNPDEFNPELLFKRARGFFTEQKLKKHAKDIQSHLENGNVEEAKKSAISYEELKSEKQSDIDLFKPNAELRKRVKDSFEGHGEPLIKFPGALGSFWNNELTRGSFVSLMGPEKRGKTFMLMELAIRALRKGSKVAFFQAGDMTEAQQIRRIAIHLSGRSDREEYCGELLMPELDCVYNQIDECDKDIRQCQKGVFFEEDEAWEFDNLVQARKEHPDYEPCRNCKEIKGSPWLGKRRPVRPLKWTQAYKEFKKFNDKYNAEFKLSTHANKTLSIAKMKSLLKEWERKEEFVPDVIVIDYADIMAPDPDFSHYQFRHQQNELWMRLRGLSEDRDCLLLTATQADAKSYESDLLKPSNFSEDKRKLAHITAMYGLNQTPEEKKIGLMRINTLAAREKDYDVTQTVKVLQRLQAGKPFLGSYF